MIAVHALFNYALASIPIRHIDQLCLKLLPLNYRTNSKMNLCGLLCLVISAGLTLFIYL